MAKIVHRQTGSVCHLLPHHTFGRNKESVNTCVSLPEISKLHVTISWVNDHWTIEDVSSNGTQLDGKNLPKGRSSRLKLGQAFNLAGLADTTWDVIDLSPPMCQLVSLKNASKVLLLDVYNLLPSEASPTVAIYKDPVKNVYLYQSLDVDASSNPRVLYHGENILIGNELWQCFLPVVEAPTLLVCSESVKLSGLSLGFDLSQDEESVSMAASGEGVNVDFGVKAHHYLLCHLARRKISDQQRGIDEKEQGWIDNGILSAELGMEETHLNVQIYRIRNQIGKALKHIIDIESFIQRRVGSIRLGVSVSNLKLSKESAGRAVMEVVEGTV